LKLENILYVSEESEEIRIAEFGLASLWSTLAGTIAYTAPEAIDRGFRGTVTFDDFAAGDMWALGVIAYAVLSGSLPFHESRHLALFAKIRNAEYNFDGERWSSISDDAKDFVRSLLNRDPNMRSTAASALSHRWVRPRIFYFSLQIIRVHSAAMETYFHFFLLLQLRVTPSNLSLSLHGRGADCADLLRIKIPHLTIEEELKQSSCDKPLAAHRSDSSDTSATTATNSSANSPLTDRSNLSPQEDSVSPSPQLSSWL
jgi:serine/threonine protein kinase